jgi:hypothetical protein
MLWGALEGETNSLTHFSSMMFIGIEQNFVGQAGCLSQLSRRDACSTRLEGNLINLFVSPYTKS